VLEVELRSLVKLKALMNCCDFVGIGASKVFKICGGVFRCRCRCRRVRSGLVLEVELRSLVKSKALMNCCDLVGIGASKVFIICGGVFRCRCRCRCRRVRSGLVLEVELRSLVKLEALMNCCDFVGIGASKVFRICGGVFRCRCRCRRVWGGSFSSFVLSCGNAGGRSAS
jgi:hypothetical protein